jgi:hypothetical protein
MLRFKLIFAKKYSEFSSVSINLLQDYMSNFNEVKESSNSDFNEFVFSLQVRASLCVILRKYVRVSTRINWNLWNFVFFPE